MRAVTHDRMTLLDAIERLDDLHIPPGQNASVLMEPTRDWDLNTSFATARRFAQYGWSEKASQLESYMVTIRDIARERPEVVWDVCGECVDIGRYLEGEPECMLSFSSRPIGPLKILVNIVARCGADAPRLLNRGIAVAGLIYALQSNGMSVSLWVGESVTNEDFQHNTIIEINSCSEYIDPSRLAFWLGHPAALRRCIFRYNEQQPESIRDRMGFHDESSYGMPRDFNMAKLSQQGMIYLPFPETADLEEYETPQKAYEAIKAIVNPQGIVFEE